MVEGTPTDTPVAVAIAEGVATVTLADPDNRNALGPAMVGGLLEALAAADADPRVRAIVLTNQGRVFCAGADLRAQTRPTREVKGAPGLDALLTAIVTSTTPVVARIDGHCVAGGMGLAAACDISIARDDALFGFTEVRVGVVPAIISVVCLPKMRRGDAMEAFLRGGRFPGPRAAELGLINRAVPGAALDAAVAEVLDDLRAGGPTALGLAKRLVHEVPALSAEEAFARTTAQSAGLFGSAEAAEGMAAFLEKRPPAWAAPSAPEPTDGEEPT